jgi:hypothetical protein
VCVCLCVGLCVYVYVCVLKTNLACAPKAVTLIACLSCFSEIHKSCCTLLQNMSNSNTTQETLEIMKESEKKLVEESVNKNKFISKTPSKEDVEKEGEENGLRQETQVRVKCAVFTVLEETELSGSAGD